MELDRAFVEMARSKRWTDRARAGQALVEYVGGQEADSLLRELLLDTADSAVIADTAASLLERGDTSAWRVFFGAWSVASAAQADHLGGALSGALFAASLVPEKTASIKNVLTLLTSDADENVRAGATHLRSRILAALPD
jgi:hypothetical protein